MEFRRDRLTWVAYVLLAWFAFLQATPGLVIPHLRHDLHMSYSVGGLHVAAFAAGAPSPDSSRTGWSAASGAVGCCGRRPPSWPPVPSA